MDVSPTTEAKCSGLMTLAHDGVDPQTVSVGINRTATMCRACRDSAGALGLIERRRVVGATEAWCQNCDQPATITVRDIPDDVTLCNACFMLAPDGEDER